MAKKITMVRIRIGAEKGGVRSVSVTRGKKTVTGSLEGSQAAQKKGLQRLIRAWCRTGVKVVMTVEGSKEVCTYCKEGTRYVCTKSTRKFAMPTKPAKPGRKPAKPGKTEEVAYPVGLETPEKRAYNKELNRLLLSSDGESAAHLFRLFIRKHLQRELTLKQALAEWRAQSRRKPTAAKPTKPAKPAKPAKPGRKPSAYNKFVAAQRKAGKTMAQAAAAWRAHKAETGKTEVIAKPGRKPVSATAKTEVMAKPTKPGRKPAKPAAAKPAKPAATKPGRKVSAYNKFVAAQRKAGKSMKEAAAAWRAQGGSAAKPTKPGRKPTKPKTPKASSAALPAVGDVVAAAALRSARRKHGTGKHRGSL